VVALSESQALSAAYAIACAADEIVVTPSGAAGSIGVWSVQEDSTVNDAKMGMSYQFVASGDAKVDRNPHVGITEESVKRIRDEVDASAEAFFSYVSERRGISVESIRALQGGEFFGQSAVNKGLADRVVNSWNSFSSEEEMPKDKNGREPGEPGYDEALAAIQRAADDDKDKVRSAKAKRALRAWNENEPEEKKDEPAKAAAEEKEPEEKEKEPAKAAAEEKEPEEKKEEPAKALLALAEQVQTLASQLASRDAADAKNKEESERARLLASRPDFGEAVCHTLASASLSVLRNAVETWPRARASAYSAAIANVPSGITPDVKSNSHRMTPEEAQLFARSSGSLRAQATGPVQVGNSFSIGYSDPSVGAIRAKKLADELAAINAEVEGMIHG